MHTHWKAIATLIALTASPLTAQDVRIATANTNTTVFGGGYGTSVASLGDWSGTSEPEYAVGSPTDTTGGPMAGMVRIHDGATGNVVRTVTGVGFSGSCAGATIPVGDSLGSRMAVIDDFDGDSKSELLVSRFNAPALAGGCQQIGHGGFMIIFSNPATPNFTFTSATTEGLGVAVSRIDVASNGRPQFIVSNTTGQVRVFQRASVGSSPVLVGTVSGFGQTATAICSAGTIGGVAAFAINSPQQVLIKDTAGTSYPTISPPPLTGFGTAFGTSLAFFADPVNGNGIVIGEPAFATNSGRVHLASIAGSVIIQTSFGNSGDMLGQVVAAGADINSDGNVDYLASTQGGNQALIINRFGAQAARTIALPVTGGTSIMNSIAVATDMTSDTFPDVIFGAVAQGRSWVYFGGPEASVVSLGTSCSQSGPALPNLFMNSIPVVGSAPVFIMTNATPGSFSGLLAGVADPIGTVIPPGSCLAHLQLSPAPITGFSALTDPSGGWISNPVPIPRLLGSQFGFQAVTISSGPGNPLEFSNGLNMTIGW